VIGFHLSLFRSAPKGLDLYWVSIKEPADSSAQTQPDDSARPEQIEACYGLGSVVDNHVFGSEH